MGSDEREMGEWNRTRLLLLLLDIGVHILNTESVNREACIVTGY